MRFLSLLFFIALSFTAGAQQIIFITVTDSENSLPVLASVQIKEHHSGSLSDSLGKAKLFFPANGKYTIIVSATGYDEQQATLAIPFEKDTLHIALQRTSEEMEEVIVQSTRTSRTIANVPTRVETIALEEIDEKNNMRPGNVAMLLHESTGIQVQQTSATSGNASIRIQGLDGRYTQLLKDGFPNFGNFSSGLSVLEIPPLDLKQVEIIKGPASPLFGGGAIAGVVNFISKTPKAKPEYQFIINGSNIGQANLGSFVSGKHKKIGYTLLALYSHSKAFDVDKDDFTELPQSNEYTFHPKLFFYPSQGTTITIGHSFGRAERKGGDLQVINHGADAQHQYVEQNKTHRNISTFALEKQMGERKTFAVKQSISSFDRSINVPGYSFAGVDHTFYSDVSYLTNGSKHSLVTGGNFTYNKFAEKKSTNSDRSNTLRTGGLYGQYTLDATQKIKLETGLRVDLANYANNIYSKTEAFVLPRISLLANWSRQWSSRIGGGIGYKTPTLFTEETETMQYRNLTALNVVRSERSAGGTADVNFKTRLNDVLSFSANQMFFYTRITRPLVLLQQSGQYYFANENKPVYSAGFETNAKLIYKENWKVFLGYTFTQTKATYAIGQQFLPLVPRSKLNSALIYEKEGSLKLGLEGYFTGRQYLSNGNRTPSFSEFGFMAEKIFPKFSLYINFENFTDTRQSRYQGVVNGPHLNPVFDEIWTHTEGFVVNGGVKIKF